MKDFKNIENPGEKEPLKFFDANQFYSNNVNQVKKMSKNHYFVTLLNKTTLLVFRNRSVFQIGGKKNDIIFGKIVKKGLKEDIVVYTNNQRFYCYFDCKSRKKLLNMSLNDYFLERSVIKNLHEMDCLDLVSVRIACEQKVLDVHDIVKRNLKHSLCKKN